MTTTNRIVVVLILSLLTICSAKFNLKICEVCTECVSEDYIEVDMLDGAHNFTSEKFYFNRTKLCTGFELPPEDIHSIDEVNSEENFRIELKKILINFF